MSLDQDYPESDRTSWAWGPYLQGMGQPHHPERIQRACMAIKQELLDLGFAVDVTKPRIGGAAVKAIKQLQKREGLTVDGKVGRLTANALWRARIQALQTQYDIADDWLRAMVHWESADDPGARNPGVGTYADGGYDRGLVQLNSTMKPATDDEAWSPMWALDHLAEFLSRQQGRFQNCAYGAGSPIELAVGSWRSPVGAQDWCQTGAVTPNREGTWAERSAYYVSRVNVDGRAGWVG